MQAEQTSFAHGPREDAEPDSLEALFIKGERRAQNQQEDMHRLRQHFQTSRAIISKKEYELRQAKRRITHLEEELNDCRAQVFRSIPVYEVSDTMLSEEFRALRENLANWVEGLPELTTFTTGFQLALEHFQVFALSKPWPSSFPVAAAEAQSEIIQRVAFQHLFNELFCEMLPAAPSSDQSLLENLQNGMSRLEPKKGKCNHFQAVAMLS